MIIVMEKKATEENINKVCERLTEYGFRIQVNRGEIITVIEAFGDKTGVSQDRISALPGVKEIKVIREPFRLACRDRNPEDTVITFKNGVKIGGNEKAAFVGPCSVEDYDGLLEVAVAAKEMQCEFLRGGAFKPRTSPYDFQGYEEKALKYLKQASEATGLLTVTEVMDADDIPMISEYVDVLQVGARNMQNFKLLTAVGKSGIPVILKRGLCSTITEFLLAAEYIMYNGNPNVILCERGIRSFDNKYTRNVVDIAAIPVIKKLSHLPIILDPSHATGQRYLIEPISKAGLVVGADGLMIEVHHNPETALSDGKQSLSIPEFKEIMARLNTINGRLAYEKNCLSANVK